MVQSAQKLTKWKSDQNIAKLAKKSIFCIVTIFALALTLNAYYQSGLLPFYDLCMNVDPQNRLLFVVMASTLITSFIGAIFFDIRCFLTIKEWKENRANLKANPPDREERHLLNEPLMRSSIILATYFLPVFLWHPFCLMTVTPQKRDFISLGLFK